MTPLAPKRAWWDPRRWLRIEAEASPADYIFQRKMIAAGFIVVVVALAAAGFFRWGIGTGDDEAEQIRVAGLVDLAAQAAVFFALFIPIARGLGVVFAGLPLVLAVGLDIFFRIAKQEDPGWLLYAIAVLVIVNALIAGIAAKRGEDQRRAALQNRQLNQVATHIALNATRVQLQHTRLAVSKSLKVRQRWALAAAATSTVAVTATLVLQRQLTRR